MKKALLAVLAVALVIGFAGCDIFKPGVDYFRVKEGAIAKYETTVIKHDSTYDAAEDKWNVTEDTTVTKTDTECVGETELDDGTVVWEFKTDTFYSYMAFDKDNDEVDFYNTKADTEPYYSIPYALDNWTQPYDTVDVITYEAETTEDVTIGEETYKDADKIKVTYPEIEGMTYLGAYDWWDKDYGKIKSWFKTEMVVEGSLYLTIDVTTELTDFTK